MTSKDNAVLRSLTVAAVAAATVAACGSNSTTSSSPTTATPSGSAPSTINAPLSARPSGTAALSWDSGTKTLSAKVKMLDFTPGSAHAMRIRQGICAGSGDALVSFPDVTANSEGVVDTTVTSPQPSASGPAPGTSLSVYLAPSAQLGDPGSLGFTPISCADIPSAASDPLAMAPSPQPGQHPEATVQVTHDAAKKTLSVTVSANGLVPGTGHAEHLHRGSCGSPKPLPAGILEYPLDDLVASPTGDAQVTKVFTNVDETLSGWYLNVHLGSSDQIFQDKQPTLYFQPILCGEIGK
jgi:hypothetical protein